MPLDQSATHAVSQQPHRLCGQPREAATPSGCRPPIGIRWFAVSTYPQAERRAIQNLAQAGYATYLPLVAVRRRDRVLRSLVHLVEIPLFASYAFVRFDRAKDPWWPIIRTPGVYALLMDEAAQKPIPVTEGAVEVLQATEAQRALIPPPTATLAPGTAVKVLAGFFKGCQAVVKAAFHPKVRVTLMVLGGLRDVTLDLGDVSSIQSPPG
jgi:transcription antitermination factor NusG